MAVTNYYSANGELYGESAGGVMTTYMTDALGSTIGTFQSGAVVNSYAYSPYGLLISKTGAGSDPRFLWNARSGYRTTLRQHAGEYVRRRHYDPETTTWLSLDPLWPDAQAYGYGQQLPTTISDPFGLIPLLPILIPGRTAGAPTPPWMPPFPRPTPPSGPARPACGPPWWQVLGIPPPWKGPKPHPPVPDPRGDRGHRILFWDCWTRLRATGRSGPEACRDCNEIAGTAINCSGAGVSVMPGPPLRTAPTDGRGSPGEIPPGQCREESSDCLYIENPSNPRDGTWHLKCAWCCLCLMNAWPLHVAGGSGLDPTLSCIGTFCDAGLLP